MSDDLKLHLLIAALHSEEPLEFAGSASNRGQNAHTVHMCDIVCHLFLCPWIDCQLCLSLCHTLSLPFLSCFPFDLPSDLPLWPFSYPFPFPFTP